MKELKNKTRKEFRERDWRTAETLDDLLPEAYATVRERRSVCSAWALPRADYQWYHSPPGHVAEMKTGEEDSGIDTAGM